MTSPPEGLHSHTTPVPPSYCTISQPAQRPSVPATVKRHWPYLLGSLVLGVPWALTSSSPVRHFLVSLSSVLTRKASHLPAEGIHHDIRLKPSIESTPKKPVVRPVRDSKLASLPPPFICSPNGTEATTTMFSKYQPWMTGIVNCVFMVINYVLWKRYLSSSGECSQNVISDDPVALAAVTGSEASPITQPGILKSIHLTIAQVLEMLETDRLTVGREGKLYKEYDTYHASGFIGEVLKGRPMPEIIAQETEPGCLVVLDRQWLIGAILGWILAEDKKKVKKWGLTDIPRLQLMGSFSNRCYDDLTDQWKAKLADYPIPFIVLPSKEYEDLLWLFPSLSKDGASTSDSDDSDDDFEEEEEEDDEEEGLCPPDTTAEEDTQGVEGGYQRLMEDLVNSEDFRFIFDPKGKRRASSLDTEGKELIQKALITCYQSDFHIISAKNSDEELRILREHCPSPEASQEYLTLIGNNFRQVMNVARDIFGPSAFRRWDSTAGAWDTAISPPLWLCIYCALSRVLWSGVSPATLQAKADDVRQVVQTLCQNGQLGGKGFSNPRAMQQTRLLFDSICSAVGSPKDTASAKE